jgi:hypothetical protein
MSNGMTNAVKLAAKLETSPKTIHRDLDFMRERLGMPIEYDRHRWGYVLSRSVHVCAVCAALATGELKPASGAQSVVQTTESPATVKQDAAAIIAAESLPMLEAEAKERMSKAAKGKELVPDLDKGQARTKAAEIAGVNPHYVSDAKAKPMRARKVHKPKFDVANCLPPKSAGGASIEEARAAVGLKPGQKIRFNFC